MLHVVRGSASVSQSLHRTSQAGIWRQDGNNADWRPLTHRATACPMSPYNDSISADPGFDGCASSEGQSGSPMWCAPLREASFQLPCRRRCLLTSEQPCHTTAQAPSMLPEHCLMDAAMSVCRLQDPDTDQPLVIGVLTFGPAGYDDDPFTGTLPVHLRRAWAKLRLRSAMTFPWCRLHR